MSLLLGSLRAQEHAYSCHIGKCDESGYCIVLRRGICHSFHAHAYAFFNYERCAVPFSGEETGTLAYPELERCHSARVCSIRTSSKT